MSALLKTIYHLSMEEAGKRRVRRTKERRETTQERQNKPWFRYELKNREPRQTPLGSPSGKLEVELVEQAERVTSSG